VEDGYEMTLNEYVSRFADSAGTLLKVDGGSAAPLPEIHPHAASVRLDGASDEVEEDPYAAFLRERMQDAADEDEWEG
jgi:hypothetical protein